MSVMQSICYPIYLVDLWCDSLVDLFLICMGSSGLGPCVALSLECILGMSGTFDTTNLGLGGVRTITSITITFHNNTTYKLVDLSV